MVNCDICNASVPTVTIDGPIYYCDVCWYNKTPPIMVFTKLWDAKEYTSTRLEVLFSPKSGRYVYPEKGQLDKCGFKLFNKKIFLTREANPHHREVFTYRYYGKVRCLALTDYKAWPSGMRKCCKIGCTVY